MSNKVSLVFKSKKDKQHFLTELVEGWGEEYCDLDWEGDKSLHAASVVHVTLLDSDEKEDEDSDDDDEDEDFDDEEFTED